MGVKQTKMLENFEVDSDRKEDDFKQTYKKVLTTIDIPKNSVLEWKRCILDNKNVDKNIHAIMEAVKFIQVSRNANQNTLLLLPKDKEQDGLTFVAAYFMILAGFSVEQSLRAVRAAIKEKDHAFKQAHVEAMSAIRDRTPPKQIRDELVGTYELKSLIKDVTTIYDLAGFAKPTEQQINLEAGHSSAEQGRKFSEMMRKDLTTSNTQSSPATDRKKKGTNVQVKDLASLVTVYSDKVLSMDDVTLTQIDMSKVSLDPAPSVPKGDKPTKNVVPKDLTSIVQQRPDSVLTFDYITLVNDVKLTPIDETHISQPSADGSKKTKSDKNDLSKLAAGLSMNDILMDNETLVPGLKPAPQPKPAKTPKMTVDHADQKISARNQRVRIVWAKEQERKQIVLNDIATVDNYLSSMNAEERQQRRVSRTGIRIIKAYVE